MADMVRIDRQWGGEEAPGVHSRVNSFSVHHVKNKTKRTK
jgi:hypothetical protein